MKTEISVLADGIYNINKNGRKFTMFTLKNSYVVVMPNQMITTPCIIQTDELDDTLDTILLTMIKSNNIILDLEKLKKEYVLFDQNILGYSYKAYEIITNKFKEDFE